MEAPIETETPVVSVGTYLRELRARRGTSIEELGRVTRVASRYLEALEADAHESLPAPVFTRGFIRAYCQAVGQPADEALALYDAREVGPLPRVTLGAPPAPRETERAIRSRSAVLVSLALVLVLGGALFAVALIIQPRDRGERMAASSPRESRSEPPAVAPTRVIAAPFAPPAPAVPPGAPPPSPGPAPVATTARPPAAPVASVQVVPPQVAPPAGTSAPAPTVQAVTPPNLDVLAGVNSPYRLVARTSEATWIRVRTDDGRNSEESIPAGEVREWVSNRPFILTVGNAAGVSLELNGRPVPPLGARGAVIPRLVLPPETR